MIFGLLMLLFCLVVPGFVLLHSKRFQDLKGAPLGIEERAFYSVLISVAVSSSFLIALLPFSLVSVGNLFLVDLAFVLLIFIVSKGMSFPEISVDRRAIVPIILLVIICLALYTHPSEELSARHDIGVYLNTGIGIGKTGSITAQDLFMAGVPEEYLSTLYSIYPEPFDAIQGKQFPDIVITDASGGSVLPIQPPLFQTWVGIFYSAFGPSGITWVSPLFATLSVIGIFFLTRTAFGNLAAVVSSSLSAICFSQVFFAQYSSPEILFQMLMVSGLLFLLLMWKRPSWSWAIASALCFGLLFFVRIDAIMIALPVAAIMFLSAWYHYFPGHWKTFIFLMAAQMASFIVYAFVYLGPYIDQMTNNLSKTYHVPLTLEIAMVLFIVALLLFIVLPLIIARREHMQETNDTVRHMVPWKIVCLAIGAYIVFLVLSSSEVGIIEGLPRGNVDPLSVLSMFISPIAVVLGLMGIFIGLREKSLSTAMILTVSSMFLLLYLFTIPNNPAFPWLTRRHITVVIPIFLIFSGYMISYLFERARPMAGKRSLVLKGLAVSLVAGMVLWSAVMLPTLTTTQFDGYSEQVSEIAADYDENDVILDSGMFTDVSLSMNLKYGYGLNAVYLWNLTPSSDNLNHTLDWMIGEGYDVYFFSVSQSRTSTYFKGVDNYSLVKVNEYYIRVDKLLWENKEFNNRRSSSDVLVEVYQVIPKV